MDVQSFSIESDRSVDMVDAETPLTHDVEDTSDGSAGKNNGEGRCCRCETSFRPLQSEMESGSRADDVFLLLVTASHGTNGD